jgi:hypothetical protein
VLGVIADAALDKLWLFVAGAVILDKKSPGISRGGESGVQDQCASALKA